MNDAIVCEKCKYDLFMICPDGLTVCNHCGEFSTVPNVPPAIDDETKRKIIEVCELINSGKSYLIDFDDPADGVIVTRTGIEVRP